MGLRACGLVGEIIGLGEILMKSFIILRIITS